MSLPPRGQPPDDFAVAPVAYMTALHRHHGDVVATELNDRPVVFCAGTAATSELFRVEPRHLRVFNTELVHELFGPAIFNLHGEAHLAARALLRPGLTGSSLSRYAPRALALAREHAARWQPGEPNDLHARARDFTMAACARLIVGLAKESDEQELAELFDRFAAATELPDGERQSQDAYWLALDAAARLRAFFRQRIAATCPGAENNLVARVVSQTRPSRNAMDNLPDHLLAVLVATRETTASLITWLLLEVARRPRLASSVRIESARVNADPGLLLASTEIPALQAALREAERVHSPNTISLRTVMTTCQIAGYELPGGWLAGYSPALNSGLLTFGRGLHACPGRRLAELLTLALTSALLARGGVRLTGDGPGDLKYLPVKAPRTPVLVRLDPAGQPA